MEKLKNINENKVRFFALYWGQKVSYSLSNEMVFQVSSLTLNYHEDTYLLLTNLKDITDRDAVDVAKTLDNGSLYNIRRTSDCIYLTQWPYEIIIYFNGSAIYYLDKSTEAEFNNSHGILEAYDFLRSRSYLLPYQNLTTVDLVEYGWAKTK